MNFLQSRNLSLSRQYLISLSAVIIIAVICFFTVEWLGYRVVALVLLLVVSILAILFDIFPVLLTALLSALVWNFFFIPPIFNFHIGSPEDGLMFLMYFVVALINAVLTFKIREYEKKARDREEKEKSIVLYNTLLNSLSHELRTPIAAIIGAIDTIQENNQKLSEGNRHDLFREIERASLRLNRQVENLLSMNRLDAGILRPRLDWCDINEIIFHVVRSLQEDAKDHRLRFSPNEAMPLYWTDRVSLEQVFHNIIDNALQHTPKATVIEIGLDWDDESFSFIVQDNGPGFPEGEIGRVFDKFYRLGNSRTGGTGLGLSIVKGFVEYLGGNVTLENLRAGGAKFRVYIPAKSSTVQTINHE